MSVLRLMATNDQGLRMNSQRNNFEDAASVVSAEERNHHATAVVCAGTAHSTTCLLELLLQLARKSCANGTLA